MLGVALDLIDMVLTCASEKNISNLRLLIFLKNHQDIKIDSLPICNSLQAYFTLNLNMVQLGICLKFVVQGSVS